MVDPRFKSNESPRGKENSAEGKSPKEQRMFSRFRVNFPTRYRNLIMGRRGLGKCLDVGAGGVRVETNQMLDPRTPVEMWIEVNDGYEPINLKGRVVWSEKIESENYKTGVVFDCPRLIAFSRVLKMVNK